MRRTLWFLATGVVLAGGLATAGTIAAASAGAAATPSSYTAVTPTRLLDTRDGTGQPSPGPIPPKSFITLNLAGVDPVPSTATAVAMNVTAVGPTSVGYLTAYPHGQAPPNAANLNFVRNQTVANLVVVTIGTGGAIDLYNGSAGTVDVVADVAGYFAPLTASNSQGAFVPLAPRRLLDTRPNSIPGKGETSLQVTGVDVPDGVSAVVLNLAAVDPAGVGYVTAYAAGGSRPTTSSVNFARGQTVPNLVVAPVSSDGKVAFYNGSAGRVDLVVDISGYVLGGDPVASGALGALAPARLLDTRFGIGAPKARVAPQRSLTLTVAGRGGVPLSGVSAVVLELTAVAPTGPGFITAYADQTSRPTVSSLNLVPKQTVANLVFAPVGSDGKVILYNGSPTGSVDLVADVSGYVLATDLPLPTTSTSHYVRNISGAATDAATMTDEGKRDAASGSKFVLLDIGAQLNDRSGVQLSATSTNLSYAQLVTAIQAYLDGFGSVSGATVAVGTNNDADFGAYPADARGADWANKVINQLTPGAGVTVSGADDIEADFASTEAQAELWETTFLRNTSKNLIFVGAANGCPVTYGATSGTCNSGWTEAQHYRLAGGLNLSRIQALPQIYAPEQAVQWANIDATGGSRLTFAGALTEHAACPSASTPGCNLAALPSTQGWASLYHALSTVVSAPSLPALTDLQVDN